MAAVIAGNAPLVVRALKKLARDVLPRGPLETVAEVNRLIDNVWASDDFAEGKRAFAERRKPRFEGK
jgi:enoyl-CoA hydratase